MHVSYLAFFFNYIAPDGSIIFSPRAPIRPPGPPPQLGHPPTMVHSPGNPQTMSGGQIQNVNSLRPGTPQMGPGTPQMGPGTPQMGPGTPQMGPSTPQMGPGTPQMASPRMASAPTQMSPGAPQMPNIPQTMSHQNSPIVMSNQRAPLAPKLEPPDNMDARTMWLPKRMNHCKLIFLFNFFMLTILLNLFNVCALLSFNILM